MKPLVLTLSLALLALIANATSSPADFSGAWSFNPVKSQNLGMMGSMEYSLVITQTPAELIIKDHTVMMGVARSSETKYALNGANTENLNYMGDKSATVTHWDGPRLVTTWSSSGAIAGTTTVRTETRSVSSDGKTMTVEMTNGAKPSIIFIFDRK